MKKLVPMVLMLGLCLGLAGTAHAWVSVKVGGQFVGSASSHPEADVLGVSLPVGDLGATQDIQPGWSIAGEMDIPIGDHVAVGAGVQYLFERGYESDAIPGYFSFLPVYGQAQAILTGRESNFRPYIKGQVGYNWFFWSDAMEGSVRSTWDSFVSNVTGSSKGGGLYWSAGLGAYIFKYALVEVMYMSCQSNYTVVDSSLATLSVGHTYRSLAVFVGFHF